MTTPHDRQLNPAQLEAVRTLEGPVLVLAGAGSGKTRTIVHRLAHLAEQGVDARSILLLTFTRKAAQEMLHRAALLLGPHHGPGGGFLHGVQGGTFHGFAHGVLRRTPPPGWPQRCTLLDRNDCEHVIREVKADRKLGKGDRSFPKVATVLDHWSRSRNKELALEDVVKADSFHLIPYTGAMLELGEGYTRFKREKGLLDYDDLLFGLESLLREDPAVAQALRQRFRYLMVDEYQDTNLVQDRLVRLLAGEGGNVMAVGDDAQSIYAFRGANVANILSFPDRYPGTKVIKLEQNYRSTQPVLDLTNRILSQAKAQFRKELFSQRTEGPLPRLVRALSDRSQAQLVCDQVVDQIRRFGADEVAVLFRAGYHSYHVEVALNKAGVPFRKFGGLKYTEASHIKDALAYLRVVVNPADAPAWQRMLGHLEGVGPKTAAALHEALLAGDAARVEKVRKKQPLVGDLLALLDRLRAAPPAPAPLLEEVLAWFQPLLEKLYPDDHPRRLTGLEELLQIAAGYEDTSQFLADLHLEDPGPSGSQGPQGEATAEPMLTLSTIHSAKGLEWRAVSILDLVEERFPSRQAMQRAEDFEEERRLLYVACTRAKDELSLFVPLSIYQRGQAVSEPAVASPFIREIGTTAFEEFRENYGGGLARQAPAREMGGVARLPQRGTQPLVGALANSFSGGAGDATAGVNPSPGTAPAGAKRLGFARHKIFGRGKVVKQLPPDKCQVNFPNFGLKVILTAYLEWEE